MKVKKGCTGLLLNCALKKGHKGDCKPQKKAFELPVSKERTSPCASFNKKCRHQWCAGYNVGYDDGKEDAVANQ